MAPRCKSFGYKVLRLLSRRPEQGRYYDPGADYSLDQLAQLKTMFSGFLSQISGKTVVDFGCGQGIQSLALAKNGAKHVVGVDIHTGHIQNARREAERLGLQNIMFYDAIDPLEKGGFDVLISHNSMEHFENPLKMLHLFRRLIHNDGKVYITFGPPWYSPYGAHTNMFCRFPWIHLLFSEKTVMQVRSHFTDDNAEHYEDIRGGLNKMTLKKYTDLIAASDFRIEYESHIYALKLRFLHRIPVLRELLLYHINTILAPERRPEKP